MVSAAATESGLHRVSCAALRCCKFTFGRFFDRFHCYIYIIHQGSKGVDIHNAPSIRLEFVIQNGCEHESL